MNNSRIIGPHTNGPEPVLARATRKEQLLIADVQYHRDASKVRALAKCHSWLFLELGRAMAKLARKG